MAFSYQAESWTRPRRIIAKVEYTHLGSNQRFVVTNLSRNPQMVYDDIYVLRGDVENRIKELKLELKADRLSCHRFLAKQFRLLLHTAAYCLFWLLRRHLQGTELASAQVSNLRLKLLNIGARIRETSRRIWVHLASSYPYRELLALVLQIHKYAVDLGLESFSFADLYIRVKPLAFLNCLKNFFENHRAATFDGELSRICHGFLFPFTNFFIGNKKLCLFNSERPLYPYFYPPWPCPAQQVPLS